MKWVSESFHGEEEGEALTMESQAFLFAKLTVFLIEKTASKFHVCIQNICNCFTM